MRAVERTVSAMASISGATASRKRRISEDSRASGIESSNDGTSTDSEDDIDTPDFSLDDESSSNHPGTSAVVSRVSTSFRRDHLPVAAQRVEFRAQRQPGVNLGIAFRSAARHFMRAVDFFLLFFTSQIIGEICKSTNKYAWMHIFEKPTYSERDYSWREVTEEEMLKFIGLLVYMGIVQVPRLHCYWSTRKLFSGLLLLNVMPRKRFKALLAFLSVSDPGRTTVAFDGKLHRVSSLLRHISDSSAQFFQSRRNLFVDERMVKSKGH